MRWRTAGQWIESGNLNFKKSMAFSRNAGQGQQRFLTYFLFRRLRLPSVMRTGTTVSSFKAGCFQASGFCSRSSAEFLRLGLFKEKSFAVSDSVCTATSLVLFLFEYELASL